MEMLDEVSDVILGEELDDPPLIEDLLSPRRRIYTEPSGTGRLSGWSLAGAGLLTAAAIGFFVLRPDLPTSGETAFGTGELVTGSSESTTVRLGDGSVVRLGPDSRLRVID